MSGECDKCGNHTLKCTCKSNFGCCAPGLYQGDALKTFEAIHHPKHYQGKSLEVIDIIDDFQLGFCLGNAIKYILRAGKKNERQEDLQKAIWYIQREIDGKNKLKVLDEKITLESYTL